MWDLSRLVAKSAPDPDMARIAIDAYLASLINNTQPDIHREFEAAIRALDLSEMLRDAERIELARNALLLSREQAYQVAAGNALAACNQSGAAQPLIDELAKSFPLDTLLNTVWLPLMKAQLELNRGNGAAAIGLLEPARRYEVHGDFWPQYVRGMAYLKLKNGTQAAAEFQTIISHRGWYPLSPLYRLAHVGLARAAALNGDAPSARRAYQDFLALWKDADPSIPILVSARQEYDKLK